MTLATHIEEHRMKDILEELKCREEILPMLYGVVEWVPETSLSEILS